MKKQVTFQISDQVICHSQVTRSQEVLAFVMLMSGLGVYREVGIEGEGTLFCLSLSRYIGHLPVLGEKAK